MQHVICFQTSKSAPRHVKLESKHIISCNVVTVTCDSKRRGVCGRVLTCTVSKRPRLGAALAASISPTRSHLSASQAL